MPLSSSAPAGTRRRNLTLEVCKLVAACFVVFIHVPFPAPAGTFVLCLARFAVPMFFAISGWYSFQTPPKKLLKRFGHVLLLEAAGILLVLAGKIYTGLYAGLRPYDVLSYIPLGPEQFKSWLLLNDDPFSGHLWYLSASAFVYGVFWLYSCLGREKWGYRPLYLLGGLLLCAQFAMGELSLHTGLTVSFKVYRSGIFFGLPMFLVGLCLREYRDTLLARLTTARLLLLYLLGTGVSIAEWQIFGIYDLYMGLLISVPALLLLTCRHSGVPRPLEKAAALCGPVSTGMYLIHLVLYGIYQELLQWRLEPRLGAAETWLRPFVILVCSILLALGWKSLLFLISGLKKKKE